MVDVIAAGEVGGRLAMVAPLDRLSPLVVGEFRFSAEPDPPRLGSLPPLACADAYEVALELRQPAQRVFLECYPPLLASE